MLGIFHDIFEALNITLTCLEDGIGACVCATALMLRPEWLSPTDYRYSPEQKCYTGNPLDLIMGEILSGIEAPFKAVGKWFTDVFDGPPPVPGGQAATIRDQEIRASCRVANKYGHGDADKCYFERAHEICKSDKLYTEFLTLNKRDMDLSPHTSRAELRTLNKVIEGVSVFKDPLGLCRDAVQISLDMVIEGCSTPQPCARSTCPPLPSRLQFPNSCVLGRTGLGTCPTPLSLGAGRLRRRLQFPNSCWWRRTGLGRKVTPR